MSSVVLCTWEATSALFASAYLNGGPASVVYGFIVSVLGTLCIGASLAEMASMYAICCFLKNIPQTDVCQFANCRCPVSLDCRTRPQEISSLYQLPSRLDHRPWMASSHCVCVLPYRNNGPSPGRIQQSLLRSDKMASDPDHDCLRRSLRLGQHLWQEPLANHRDNWRRSTYVRRAMALVCAL